MKKVYSFLLCLCMFYNAYGQTLPYKVAVVYAVPNDVAFNQEVLDTLKIMTAEMQAWYQIATGGRTFEMSYADTVITYRAQQNRQYYVDNGNWWGSILSELQANAAAPIWTPGYITVIWAHGAGWWAGGAQGCGKDCGTVLLGVELLPKFNNPAYSGGSCPTVIGSGAWPCTPHGAYFHEFGHALGLPHPLDIPATNADAAHSIMQTHWNYPDFAPDYESPWGFLTIERQILAQNPFMKTGVGLYQMIPEADVVNLPATGPVPDAAFTITRNGSQVSFNNNSVGAFFFYWTFGDGSVSTQANPSHTFPTATFGKTDTYRVTLRASSGLQMMDTASVLITFQAEVSGFALSDAVSGRSIRDGEEIDLGTLHGQNFNITANTYPNPVGSVKFQLSGQQASTYLDNDAPYTLFGEGIGDYNSLNPGSYTLTATPYSERDGNGIAGNPFTIHFTVVRRVPPIQWEKTFGGIGNDVRAALQQTSDGGYILGGSSDSPVSGDKTQASKGGFDYWVVKQDAAGNKLWDITIGGSANDALSALKQTSDGGYILGGTSDSPISGDKTQASRGGNDYWVLKLDAAGNKVWDKTFGGIGNDRLAALRRTSDGGYILGGTSASSAGGDKSQNAIGSDDYWVVKLDAAGNKVWDKTFGGSAGDGLRDLQQTSDGGYILGGTSDSPISGDKTQASRGGTDYWVLKLDAAGNKIWDKTYGSGNTDNFTSLQQTSDGGYILAGDTWESEVSGDKTESFPNCETEGLPGVSDIWVLKLDAAGNKQWDRTYGHCEGSDDGRGEDRNPVIFQTREGGYLIGATSRSDEIGSCASEYCYSDYWVLKLNALGNQEWEKTIGGRFDDFLAGIQQTGDGGFILGGSSESPIGGDKTGDNRAGCPDAEDEFNVDCTFDIWVVKLGPVVPQGQQVQSFTLINSSNEQDIRTITPGEVINLATLPSLKLNIRANTSPPAVGSVKFVLSGTVSRTYTDDVAPYALFGDDSHGNYFYWLAPVGTYTLTATPYTAIKAGGTAGTPLTISFTVIDQVSSQYTLTVTPPTNGTVTKNPNQASYAAGSTVQLTATPASGYVFSGWTGDASGTTNPLSVVMNSNKTIGATFSPVSPTPYTLTVTPPVNGTVTKTPNQASYAAGSTVQLTATPASGYVFSGWTGDASGTTNPLSVVMNSNKTIGASFTAAPAGQQVQSFTLINSSNEQDIKTITPGEVINLATLPSPKLNIRANTSPPAVGSVKFVLSGTVSRTYTDDVAPYALFGDDSHGNYFYWLAPVGSYTLTATPYTAAKATGTAGTPLTISFTVVNQASSQYTLTVTPPTNGTVTKNPNQASYAAGSTVQLTATPASGYVFSGWTGDASGTTNPLNVVMNGNKTIGATFSPVSPTPYTLTVTPPTNGTVTVHPIQDSYTAGSTVHLTANPAAGYVFSGWTGDASGTTNPLTVVMNSNKTIGASFTAAPAGQQVVSFTLINSSNEQDIKTIAPGEVINLATLPSPKLNIRANTSPNTVGSVKFVLSGTVSRTYTDDVVPYALFGDDSKGNYFYWLSPVGSYTLTATPYTAAKATGTAGTPLTISFSVINQATTAARLAVAPQATGAERSRQASIFPNPTLDGRLQVQLGSQLQGRVRYSLLSAVGSKLAEGTLDLSKATNLLDFNFSRQIRSAGVYYLKLEGAKGQQTFKILRR